MCRLISHALHAAIDSRWAPDYTTDQWQLPEEYINFYTPLDPFIDFQRSTDCMAHRHLRPNQEDEAE